MKTYIVVVFLLLSCSKTSNETRRIHILHINDVYRISGVDGNTKGGFARLRTLRTELEKTRNDLMLLHSGDFLFPSVLSREFNGEQMIDVMNRLDGNETKLDENLLVVFGNHEFDKGKLKDTVILNRRINESDFYWLTDNISWDKGDFIQSDRLKHAFIREINNVKTGFFGLTTDIADPEYAEINNNYTEIARNLSKQLREKGAELIIALTHLSIEEDKAILGKLKEDGPDIIFGGHEHNRQSYFLQKDRYGVIKADADMRTATIADISIDANSQVSIKFKYEFLDSNITEDTKLAKISDDWNTRFNKIIAKKEGKNENALTEKIGHTNVELIGEELQIRRYETNLGNYIVDQALGAFREEKADIAFLNSGGMRLNQNIPKGSDLNERYLLEIFQYPTNLKLIKITGKQLRQVLEHSIENWTGMGWFLQISGFKFSHDVKNKRVEELRLVKNGNEVPLKDTDIIYAVTNDYLLDKSGNQDGYTMLSPEQVIKVNREIASLREIVKNAVIKAGDKGISPVKDGRINTIE